MLKNRVVEELSRGRQETLPFLCGRENARQKKEIVSFKRLEGRGFQKRSWPGS